MAAKLVTKMASLTNMLTKMLDDTKYVFDGNFTVNFSIKDGWFPILAYRENGEVYRIWFIQH